MAKLNINHLRRLFVGGFLWLLITVTAHGQSAVEAEKQARISLPAEIGQGWSAIGAEHRLSDKQRGALPNRAVYLEYGLKSVTTRKYTNGKATHKVEVFELRYPTGAYGLHTFNRAIGQRGSREFTAGRYLIAVSAEKAVDEEFVASLKTLFPQTSGALSPLPDHLPEANKTAESEIYLIGPEVLARTAGFGFLKDVIKFDGGTEAVTADYHNGDGQMALIIIEYHTPQLATDGYEGATKHYELLNRSEQDKVLIKRVGNYMVEAVNVRDMAAAQQIVAQIKYTAKVYWAGDKLSSIPLEYRPTDPTALAEAAETANIILRTFYWIGIMLMSAVILGITAGGSFFYWRRYQRRKLGTDDLYSDAGETIRLNLDDYLLSPEDAKAKLLGKGNDRR